MVHRTLPIEKKLAILQNIRDLVNIEGYSIRGACKKHQILPSLYRYWRKNEEKFRSATTGSVKSTNPGRASILAPYEAELERWIVQVRLTEFRAKTIQAQRNCLYRFLKRHKLGYRRSKRVAQTAPTLTNK